MTCSSTDGRAAGVVVNALAWRTWCTVNVWGSIPARSSGRVQLLKYIEHVSIMFPVFMFVVTTTKKAQLFPVPQK